MPGKLMLNTLIELNAADISKKVKVSPIGEVVGADGRVFSINPTLVLESILSGGVDICLDENHDFGEALGWFSRSGFEIREDGVYAALELTPKGAELVKNRSYRYLSPVYRMESRNVVGLDSVGLVNRPNLLTDALNNKKMEDKSMEQKENQITPEDVEAYRSENNKIRKDVEVLLEENKALKEQVKQFRIDNALLRNDILPNQKAFALELDEETLGKFIEVNKVNVEGLKEKTSYKQDAPVPEDLGKFASILGLSDEQIKKYV